MLKKVGGKNIFYMKVNHNINTVSLPRIRAVEFYC